jgi:hypothetical protein
MVAKPSQSFRAELRRRRRRGGIDPTGSSRGLKGQAEVVRGSLAHGSSLAVTCRDVEAAPMSRPRDWATSEVMVPNAAKRTKRTASDGCDVIQYTMLQ